MFDLFKARSEITEPKVANLKVGESLEVEGITILFRGKIYDNYVAYNVYMSDGESNHLISIEMSAFEVVRLIETICEVMKLKKYYQF